MQTDEQLRESIRGFIDIVNELSDEFAKIGHPIPVENSKSFYLKCCWVLGQLNKVVNKTGDENVVTLQRTIKALLPIIKESVV